MDSLLPPDDDDYSDPFADNIRRQTRLYLGPHRDIERLDPRIRHVLDHTGTFRPAQLSPLLQFGATFNAGWVPHSADVYRLYRIPDGWTSLHLMGINITGYEALPVSPRWFLGGGTKRMRLLHLNGMAGCFNLRVPPWSCLPIFGVPGRQIPEEPQEAAAALPAVDFSALTASIAAGVDLQDALERYEQGIAAAFDGIYEALPERCFQQIEVATRAARIGLHYRGLVTVQEVADELDLSVAHLRRIVNGLAPISLSTWLDTIRFWHAVDLINDPDEHRDLTQIAHLAGFADSSHMTRQFRRHVGMPPRTFQRELGRRLIILGGIMAVVDLPVDAAAEPPPA